jgi:hypothetical protein
LFACLRRRARRSPLCTQPVGTGECNGSGAIVRTRRLESRLLTSSRLSRRRPIGVRQNGERMNNPKVMAIASAGVAGWLIYSMATATEQPSMALAVLQYVLIAGVLISFVGSVMKLMKSDPQS